MDDVRKLIALNLNALDLLNFIHVNKEWQDYDLYFWKQLFEKNDLSYDKCDTINEWLKLYDRSLWAIGIQKDICNCIDNNKYVVFDTTHTLKDWLNIIGECMSDKITENYTKYNKNYNGCEVIDCISIQLCRDALYHVTLCPKDEITESSYHVFINKFQLTFLYHAYQHYMFESYII